MKALVITAHPDDETIWMGGTIIENKDLDWTIISLCRAEDKDRKPRFEKACKYFGAKSIISDLDDEILKPLTINEVMDKIKSLLPKEKFEYVFTHGPNGEYGHMRHIETYKAVKEMIEKNVIECKKAFCFSYIKKNDYCVPEKGFKNIKLKRNVFIGKRYLINQIYGFSEDGFESKSCNKMESFNLIK